MALNDLQRALLEESIAIILAALGAIGVIVLLVYLAVNFLRLT